MSSNNDGSNNNPSDQFDQQNPFEFIDPMDVSNLIPPTPPIRSKDKSSKQNKLIRTRVQPSASFMVGGQNLTSSEVHGTTQSAKEVQEFVKMEYPEVDNTQHLMTKQGRSSKILSLFNRKKNKNNIKTQNKNFYKNIKNDNSHTFKSQDDDITDTALRETNYQKVKSGQFNNDNNTVKVVANDKLNEFEDDPFELLNQDRSANITTEYQKLGRSPLKNSMRSSQKARSASAESIKPYPEDKDIEKNNTMRAKSKPRRQKS